MERQKKKEVINEYALGRRPQYHFEDINFDEVKNKVI